MSKKHLYAVLMLLVLTLIACPGGGTIVTPTPTPGASLASVRADVLLREGATGTLVPAGETRALAVGQAIDVDENGRARLRFLNYLIVEVFRDTNLQLESMAAPDAPPAYKFKLEAGTLYAEVDPATEVVTIESDLAVITALGTKFWVYVAPGQITWVVCKEGKMQITAQRGMVTLAADQQSWVLPGQQPHEPVEAFRNEVGDLVPLVDKLTGGEVRDEQVLQEEGIARVHTPTPTPRPVQRATRTPTRRVTPTPTRRVTPTPTRRATNTPTCTPTRTPTRPRTPTPTSPPPARLPDLTVTDISVVEGNKIRCHYQNIGKGEVPEQRVWIAIYANDERVSHSTVWTPIPAGQEGWLQTAPRDLPPSIRAKCVIDADNDVVEANEGNNALARTLEIARCLPAHELFAEIQQELELGCALEADRSVLSAWQPFELGYMIWREDTRQIYVLVERVYFTPLIPPGQWRAYADEWREGMAETSCDEAAYPFQAYPVIRGFGYVYCTQSGIRETLGSATGEEKGNQRLLQTFERGWAMHVGEWEDGIVVLTGDGEWIHYPRGERGLTAPRQLSPASGTVFDHYPRTTTVEWSAVPGAVSYTVEVDCYHCCQSNAWCTDVGQTWAVERNIKATTYTFDFVGAQPGRWRVWAVDAGGREGPKSGWWEFRYTR